MIHNNNHPQIYSSYGLNTHIYPASSTADHFSISLSHTVNRIQWHWGQQYINPRVFTFKSLSLSLLWSHPAVPFVLPLVNLSSSEQKKTTTFFIIIFQLVPLSSFTLNPDNFHHYSIKVHSLSIYFFFVLLQCFVLIPFYPAEIQRVISICFKFQLIQCTQLFIWYVCVCVFLKRKHIHGKIFSHRSWLNPAIKIHLFLNNKQKINRKIYIRENCLFFLSISVLRLYVIFMFQFMRAYAHPLTVSIQIKEGGWEGEAKENTHLHTQYI